MRRHDIDFQIFLEIGHVLSNDRKLRVTSNTAAPGASVNGPAPRSLVRGLRRRIQMR
jgi:hypothetical protein